MQGLLGIDIRTGKAPANIHRDDLQVLPWAFWAIRLVGSVPFVESLPGVCPPAKICICLPFFHGGAQAKLSKACAALLVVPEEGILPVILESLHDIVHMNFCQFCSASFLQGRAVIYMCNLKNCTLDQSASWRERHAPSMRPFGQASQCMVSCNAAEIADHALEYACSSQRVSMKRVGSSHWWHSTPPF